MDADVEIGRVIRRARLDMGWSQATLAAKLNVHQTVVSDYERGRIRSVAMRARVAAALGLPPAALGVAPIVPGVSSLTVGAEVDDMNRRDATKSLIAAAVALALPETLTRNVTHVGPADVATYRQTLDRLYTLDTTVGSGGVGAINKQMIARIRGLLHTASYSPDTGRGLHGILAAACEHDGWAAYDAERHDDARRSWLEALHAADIGHASEARVVTLASMSLQASTLKRGGEAVQLAEAAASDPSATPRVRSILAARLGSAHAVAGDQVASRRAFTDAERLLAAGPHDDDPAWTGFWGVADLASHQVSAAISLRAFAQAERSARVAVDASQGSGHARNHALYSTKFGRLLAARGDLDAAIGVLSPVVERSARLDSQRLRTGLRTAARQLGRHDYRPAREFADRVVLATA